MSLFNVARWFKKLRRERFRVVDGVSVPFTPGVEHVIRLHQGTGRDWKASPAVKPMPDDDESARINANIDKAALLERLDAWADVLQGRKPMRFQIQTENLIRGGHITEAQYRDLGEDWVLKWAKAYFSCELEQGYAKRQNVTGLQPLMPRLTPDEIADAREASRLTSQAQDLERARLRRAEAEEFERTHPEVVEEWKRETEAEGVVDRLQFEPTDEQERELERVIIEALGGEAKIAEECHGDPKLIASVKAKARSMFAGRRPELVEED